MKKKKNLTQQENQKIIAAQYRNEFFRKIKLIIDSVCGNHIYPLIPQNLIDDIYLNRSAPFKYQADYNSNIPTKILKDAKVILSNLIKTHFISLPPNNLEISLRDYYTVVFSIVIFDARITDTTFDNADIVKKALAVFVNDTATNEAANEQLYGILYSFNLGESDLRKILYWYRHDWDPPKTAPAEIGNIITIHSVTPENISVEVDGIARPAIRVGWALAYTGADWVSIKPSLLGFNSPFAEIPLKVYIQTHALNRLSERIDCFWTGNVQWNMYISLLNPKFTYDSNRNLLIEYTFFGNKAGYFRADIVNGIILIRTFLFVTNNGTPEGQLLEKNTGLQKLDKKYLNIDKLSTFMNSDLDKNEEVQRILKSSGCQCIIDLYNNMKSLLTEKDNVYNFDVMLSYLNHNNTETNLFEAESMVNIAEAL